MSPHTDLQLPPLAFIGGGNMANAMISGLRRSGQAGHHIWVVEPFEPTRASLQKNWGVHVLAKPDACLHQVKLVVWAVKPQNLKEAALQGGVFTFNALHLSVAAGIRSDSLQQWLGTDRIVRAMPNTPALVGMGQTGLYARAGVSVAEKLWIEQVVHTTGGFIWLDNEVLMDAVTALSGSGPAYVFYFIEAMERAGVAMGLSVQQAHQLAVGTFSGAAELARTSPDSVATLRERVTSKGGTTHAALSQLGHDRVDDLIQTALEAARARAQQLGDEFGT